LLITIEPADEKGMSSDKKEKEEKWFHIFSESMLYLLSKIRSEIKQNLSRAFIFSERHIFINLPR